MPILVEVDMDVVGVDKVDVKIYTELQTGQETPDFSVCTFSVS